MGVQDYSPTAGNNTTINGIAITGSSSIKNGDNALRQLMADTATGIRDGSFTANGYVAKAAGYTVVAADRGKIIDCTAALTLSLTAAATVGAGFVFIVKANGGDVTVDPNGTENINGASTSLVIRDGAFAVIACTGAAWHSLVSGNVTKTGTETLTNKTLTNPTINGAINGGPLGGFRNKIINGDGRLNQRTYTTVGDDTYWCDRHYVLTQTAAITPTILSNVADGRPSMMRLAQTQATAQRMGNAQIVEGGESRAMRGKQVTLGGWLRCSSAQSIRFAVLEWTGAEDTVTSDVVNSWTNATFTAGQFFPASNLTVAAVGSITPAANTLTQWSQLATISSSCNNLILFYWTEGTAAQNVTLDMVWGLVQGNASGETDAFSPRHGEQELALCQRYYEEGSGRAGPLFSGNVTSAGVYYAPVTFKVTKRTVPTVVLTNQTASGFAATVGTTILNVEGFQESRTATATTTGLWRSSWTADAEL